MAKDPYGLDDSRKRGSEQAALAALFFVFCILFALGAFAATALFEIFWRLTP